MILEPRGIPQTGRKMRAQCDMPWPR